MRTGHLALALVVALTASIAAQSAGTHRGLLLGGSNVSPGVSWLLQLDAKNVPAFLKTGVPGLPIAGNFWGITMDAGNNEIVLAGITMTPISIGIYNYDPATRAIVKTIQSGFPSPTAITNATNMTVNSDGNPVTVDNQSSPQAVAEFDQLARQWKRYPLPAGVVASTGIAGCEWDAFSGGYLHAAWGPPSVLYRTSPDGTFTTVLAAHTARVSGYGGTLLDNGDWVSSAASQPSYFVVSGGNWSSVATPGLVPVDVTHEKYAAPGRGIWVSSWSGGAGSAHYIDTRTGTVTTAYRGTAATWPNQAVEVVPLWDRDLSTMRAGKAVWGVTFNPGQGVLAGKGFVMAVSLAAPTRPGGIALPDGREIYIGLDVLTFLSVSGAIPPFLKGNIGTLDASGRATAQIDFSSVGTAANGTVLHFCAVALDPAASAGIAWVSDPHAFAINVLP